MVPAQVSPSSLLIPLRRGSLLVCRRLEVEREYADALRKVWELVPLLTRAGTDVVSGAALL